MIIPAFPIIRVYIQALQALELNSKSYFFESLIHNLIAALTYFYCWNYNNFKLFRNLNQSAKFSMYIIRYNTNFSCILHH